MNRPNLGFDEAEGEAPTQEFEISEGKVGEPLALRLVKFQGVQSLHVSSFGHVFNAIERRGGLEEESRRSEGRVREQMSSTAVTSSGWRARPRARS